MPRAGWCDECHAWVWVDDDGGCQHGHAPDSVRAIYDAEPGSADDPHDGDAGSHDASGPVQAPDVPGHDPEAPHAPLFAPVFGGAPDPGPRIGVGEMPRAMERFNWGVFFLPGLWPIVYGTWSLVGLWLLTLLIPIMLGGGVQSYFDSLHLPLSTSAMVALTVISDALAGAVRLWAAMNANRLLWLSEQRRLTLMPGASPRLAIDDFLRRQRTWIAWGLPLAVVALAATMPAARKAFADYGLSGAAAYEPIVWFAGEVLLGLWLARAMRRDAAPAAPSAHDGE